MAQFRYRRQRNRLKTFINASVIAMEGRVPGNGQKFGSSDTSFRHGRREVSVQHLKGENAEIVDHFDNIAEA